MRTLTSVIEDAELRPQVIRDVVTLIDQEVERKSGITGFALKAGYKAVKTLRSGRMIPDVVDFLLGEFAAAVEPIHAEYRSLEQHDGFDRYLVTNAPRAADGLLTVTDRRAERTDNRLIAGTYRKLRPTAERHVVEALPGLGRLIDTHCA